MAEFRKTREMKEQVRELYRQGFEIKKISRALNISKNTVKSIIRKEVTSEAKPKANYVEFAWVKKVDWKSVGTEFRKGVTLKVLHAEHAADVSYDSFRRTLYKLEPRDKAISMRLEHKPGESTYIDFCDGIDIIDRATGEVTSTELFVGVLPFSSYTFGEFVPNQKLDTFIRAHDSMWAFFGGISRYVVPDNLKAAVTKAHLYDPDENKTYCEYGNHNGFAVLPARPRKPRDKAAVEAAIGVIQRSFFMEVRHTKFYSLGELNTAFRAFLKKFNSGVMKDYGVSRDARFEEEKKHLHALPETPFEIAEWRFAKVHPDCEIQVGKCFYTVPYVFVGKDVRVRLSAKLVEIFETQSGNQITAHRRLFGVGKHSRFDWHYPPEKVQQTRFEVQSAKAQAERIGPRTAEAINKLFEGMWPLRGLRRAQGILRLVAGGKYTKQALEHGSDMALKFDKLRVDYIKSCADIFDKNGAPGPVSAKPLRDPETVYLHNQTTN